MKGSIERKITIGFALVVILVTLIGVAAFQNVRQFFDTNHWVDHTLVVLSQLEDTLATMVDAETGQRGYVITADEHYLEPYSSSTVNINGLIQNLRELTADNPRQQTRLDTLDPLIAEEFAIMQQIIDLRRNEGFEAAQQIISSGNGKAVMDNIRVVIAAMKIEENTLLQVRRDEVETAAKLTLITFTVLTVLAIGLLSGGYFLILRNIAKHKQSEAALKRYAKRMEILHEIDLGIINANSIQGIVESTLKHLRQIIPCQRADVMILDETSGEALVFAIAIDGDTTLGQGVRVPTPPNVFEGYDARNLRVFDDFRGLQDIMPRARRLVSEGLLCALSVLLMDRERPIGTLGLFADTPGYFTAEYQEIVAEIANQLAIAIRQMQLSEELASHAKTVEETRMFLQTTLDAFPANTTVIDPDGKIITVNLPWKHFADENGADTTTHYLGMNYLSICDTAIGNGSEEAAAAAAGIRAVIVGQQADFFLEYPCNSPLAERWFMLRVTPFEESVPRRVVIAHINITERKAAEIALREAHDTLEVKVAERTAELQAAKERVEAILNNSTDGILLIDTDFNIQQTNSSFNRLFACGPDDYFGKSLVTLFHEEDVERVTKLIEVVGTEQRGQSVEVHANRKDGRVFDTELSIGLIKDKGLVCTILDITERKVQERQLRYQSSLQENVSDAVIVTDLELGIQSWNKAAERIYGWRPEEVVGKETGAILQSEFSSPGGRDRTVQQLDEQGWSQEEVVQHHKDGSVRHILGSVTLVKDENGIPFGIIAVNRDITERKAQERQLRYNATLQENLSDAVIVTDTEFRIQSWNKAAERIYGWRADEVVGKANPEFLHTEYLSTTDQSSAIKQLGEQGWWQGEVVQHHKDGSVRHILGSVTLVKDENGIPLSIISLNHDITERKQVEEALVASEKRFSLLVSGVRDYAIYMLDTEGNVATWNSGAENIKGYTTEEILGKNFAQFYTPDSRTRGEPQHTLEIARNDGQFAGVGWRVRKDGSLFWAEVLVTPVHDAQNRLIGFSKVTRDVTERKQAEEALRESEEKFRLLLDAAPIATVITDQTGHITLINIQAETLFGFKREEIIGQMVEILVPEYALDIHVHNRATYIAAPRVRQMGMGLELFARHRDGSEFPVEIELSHIETKDGNMVMSFVVDITERKRVAAELERQRSFLSNVIDVSPSMIFVKDYDARFVLANPLVAKMYNTTIEDLIGKTDANFNPSLTEVDAFFEADRHVITSGEPLFIEEPVTNYAGETHWLQTTKVPIVSVDGKSKFVLGVSTDITERKQAEEALREQHEFLQLVINNVPGLILVKDRAGRLQLVNNREAEIHGMTPADMLGKTNADFNPNQEEIDYFLEKDRETLETGQTLFIPEETVMGRYYQTTKIPLKNRDGEYDRLLVVASDITERKIAEETLRQALAKEKELGDLKSRFVSMASHEFRTPLATILAVTETLSAYRHKLPEDQIEQRFGKIKDQISHLTDIMDDVLLLARMQARRVDFNPAKLNLDDLCRSVIDEFQSRPDVTHKLLYTCDERLQEVTLDKKLMRQIINNLMSNAVKYSPAGRTITVSLASENENLILKVQDEGIGIPEADLKYLFEPFHRAANVGAISGTGLGMVITKEAVELHGGKITVESQVGTGTSFTVIIPLR